MTNSLLLVAWPYNGKFNGKKALIHNSTNNTEETQQETFLPRFAMPPHTRRQMFILEMQL